MRTSPWETFQLTSLLGNERGKRNRWLVRGAHHGGQVCWLCGIGVGVARSRWGNQCRIEVGSAWRQGRLLGEVDASGGGHLRSGAHAISSNSGSWWPVSSTRLFVRKRDHIFRLSLGYCTKSAPINLTSWSRFCKKGREKESTEKGKKERQRKEEKDIARDWWVNVYISCPDPNS